MEFEHTSLEGRINAWGNSMRANLNRGKYFLDALLEPLAISAGTVYLAINAANIPMEQFLGGDPKAIPVAVGIGGIIGLAGAIEYHKRYIRNLMSKRFKKNYQKAGFSDEYRRRFIPQRSNKLGWFKTPLLALLTWALVSPSTSIPYSQKKFEHKYSIPASFHALRSNVEEILNMPNIWELTNGSEGQSPSSSLDTSVHAQIIRKTSTKKARDELGIALYRYQNLYGEFIREAYKKNRLGEVGIDYKVFVGLLAHESNLNPDAISYKGAAGIGQQMPWVAIQLNRRALTFRNYESNLTAYAHFLRARLRKNRDELMKRDQRFVPQESINMAAEWLLHLRKLYPKEDPRITITRYNTHPGAIRFAKREASKVLGTENVPHRDISYYLHPEGEKFAANVLAAGEIMKKPTKYNIVPIPVRR